MAELPLLRTRRRAGILLAIRVVALSGVVLLLAATEEDDDPIWTASGVALGAIAAIVAASGVWFAWELARDRRADGIVTAEPPAQPFGDAGRGSDPSLASGWGPRPAQAGETTESRRSMGIRFD